MSKRISFLLEGIFVGGTKKMGKGVYTDRAIAEGTVIEISPVIVMSKEDREHLDKTLLHDYIFEWGENSSKCCMALGFISIYNHSYESNCEYEMNFKKDLIAVKAIRNIKRGEELFINYNGDWNNSQKVWFETA